MPRRTTTYRDAGVDVAGADRLVGTIAKLAKATHRPGVLAGVGPFAAAVDLPAGYRRPVLVSSADGVGTKLEVARLMDCHTTVGIDLVAMNANDLITTGARPLFFLDYLAAGRLAGVDAAGIVRGIADGCRQADMSLVGGETAELPGFYSRGQYDLGGFCVGVVERNRLINGSRVRAGDVVVGLHSDGLHSNGYSLARRALRATTKRGLNRHVEELGCTLGEELLRPTRIYVKPVLAAVEKFSIHAMAHITGGGLPGNLVRVLPTGVRARIDRKRLPQQPIFSLLQDKGGIGRDEMSRTFNCGVGYTVIVAAKSAKEVCSFFRRRRVGASVIGEVVSGRRGLSYYDGR